MSYTAREFEKYIKQNRLNFAALTKRQERELGRLYIQFAEIAKLEADKIVNTAGLTYAQKQKLINNLLSKAADLTDDFKGILDKALLEASNLSIEADRVIMQKYQMRLSGIGVDVDLVNLLQGIPESSVRLAYKRIYEDGLKLSDRIWTLNKRTQGELKRIITEELAAGRSASSKVLEARLNKLLSPDRRLIRTSLHGRNVSFDAARLLRSERAIACREADRMSAMANPGNKGIKWLLSGAERSCETCIGLASDDSYGLGPGIFPVDELPVNPHPQCMCTTYQITLSSKQLVNNWQEWMNNKASHPELTDWYENVYKRGGLPKLRGANIKKQKAIKKSTDTESSTLSTVKKEISSKEVKVNVIKEDIGDVRVDIKPGGNIDVHWEGWGMSQSDLNTEIRKQVDEYFKPPKENYYWRATNNKNEVGMLKTLRPSKNWATGQFEKGLSVSSELDYYYLSGYDYAYRVRGTLIGYGSDGEPVLAIKDLVSLDKNPLSRKAIGKFDTVYKNKIKENVKKAGWSWEQYLEAINNAHV